MVGTAAGIECGGSLPQPLSSSPSAVMEDSACALAHRAERLRWVGCLMMYSPTLPICLLFGSMPMLLIQRGAGTPGMLEMIFFAPILIGLFASLPLIPLGLLLRFLGARRVEEVVASNSKKSLPARPPPVEGERLGWWVLTNLSPHHIELERRPVTGVLWRLMGGGIWGFALFAVGLMVWGLATKPFSQALLGCAELSVTLLTFCGTYAMFFTERRVTISQEGEDWSARSTIRWNPLAPPLVRVIYGPRLRVSAWGDAMRLTDDTGHQLDVAGFGAHKLSPWQVARLTSLIRRMMREATS